MSFLFIMPAVLGPSTTPQPSASPVLSAAPTPSPAAAQEIRAVWVSFLEWQHTDFSSESAFRADAAAIMQNIASLGANTVFAHVRPFGDALYPSRYFPFSHLCTGTQGQDPGFDPLAVLVETAHAQGLTLEAWINPYRLKSSAAMPPSIGETNLMHTHPEWCCTVGEGVYLNPAIPEAAAYVVQGVAELVERYAVDGIHFDDYFYPTKDKSIDKEEYTKYKSNGGELSLFDWRRDNVNNMIKSVYSAVKTINKSVTFGISPASDMDYDYSALYADVIKWSRNEGYIDYICPQIYFGFKNENQPFMQTTKLWCDNATCALYIALPMYKSGLSDEYAGESGKNEFKKEKNIVARQITYISKIDKIKGYYIFSYSSLKDNEETSNLYSAMQNSSV